MLVAKSFGEGSASISGFSSSMVGSSHAVSISRFLKMVEKELFFSGEMCLLVRVLIALRDLARGLVLVDLVFREGIIELDFNIKVKFIKKRDADKFKEGRFH
jgi:hypothetical protein